MQTVAGLERKIENVDRMAEELHAIKGHAKNLGRAAVGRSAEEIAARDQTKGIWQRSGQAWNIVRKC